MPALQLDALGIAEGRITIAQAVAFVLAQSTGLPPLVYSSADPEVVGQIQTQLGRAAAGAMVEHFLGHLAQQLRDRGFTRFVVAGGETSGAVVDGLGVPALEIGPEIDPGVPWTHSRGAASPVALALKSGNFGADDFFLKAWSLLA